MKGNGRICAIIAAYNARETIAAVVTGVRRHVETVLVADDGSSDDTAQAAQEAGASVIPLGENRGKGNALRILFAEARRRAFSAAIAIDADGQHDPEDIPAFLQLHREHPEAIITGSRMWGADPIPRHRLNSMIVARFFISLAANQFIEDTQCGFRLYPLSAIESISLLKERYVTESEVLMKAGDSGREIRSLPIRAHYPVGQQSHIRPVRDIAAISRYVISYLMVKWGVEAMRPGVAESYRGPGTGRDAFFVSPGLDLTFEYLTVIASLPLSTLYVSWHAVARQFGLSVVTSLAKSGVPVGSILSSVLLLPILLGVALVDWIGNRLSVCPDLTSRLIPRYYAQSWRTASG